MWQIKATDSSSIPSTCVLAKGLLCSSTISKCTATISSSRLATSVFLMWQTKTAWVHFEWMISHSFELAETPNNVSPLWTVRPSPASPARLSATFPKLGKNVTHLILFELNCLHPEWWYSQIRVCCCLLYCWRSCWILVLKKATLAWSCCDWENSKFLYCVRLVL